MKTKTVIRKQQIPILLALGFAFVVLSGSRGGCHYAGPDVIVYEPVVYEPVVYEPVVYEPVIVESVVYTGDLLLSYDFSGFSCWDMDIDTFDLAVYDAYGYLVVEEWGLPCDPHSEIRVLDLPLGGYHITLMGFDYWGYETLAIDVPIDHDDWVTGIHLKL